MKNSYGLTLILLCVFLVLPFEGKSREEQEYTFAVPTQMSAIETYHSWQPFVERLSRETATKINLRVYKTISEYEDEVMRGIPDFAFLNPYLMYITRKKVGYIPLVRDKNPLIGIIVVKKDGPVRSVQDLNNKEIAFATPNVFVASLYLRALLAEKEKISFTPQYVMSHSNVYRNVIVGSTAAGGGVNKTLNKEKEGIRSQLRVVYTTPGFAPHPLSAHPRIAPALRRAVIDAVLKFTQDSNGQELLKKVQIPQPMTADFENDYSSLESLKLEKYFVAGSE